MTKEVPFLSCEQIESSAADLLLAYGAKHGSITKPPIPADDILNAYLKVTLDFDDLPKLLNLATDVFGATWVDRKQVIIDQRLDPTNHPEMLGRYNFTVGHETGHWQLHGPLFQKNPNQHLLFAADQTPTVICRASQAKDRIEWQADFFSACLLIPAAMLKEWFFNFYGFKRISLTEIKAKVPKMGYSNSLSDDSLIERFAKPIAKDFAVSSIAMRIRLENLGMVIRQEEPRLVGL